MTRRNKRKRSAMVNAHVWNTLICPFVDDLPTLLNLRQTCSQLRYVTSFALASHVPIGKYSFEQYENICGSYQSTNLLFVNYEVKTFEERSNIIQWREKRSQITPGNLMETDVISRVHVSKIKAIATNYTYLIFAHTTLRHHLFRVNYKSGNHTQEKLMVYVLVDDGYSSVDLNEQLPHSDVMVKCFRRHHCQDHFQFDLQLVNNTLPTWKLTIAYHDVDFSTDSLTLYTNATEIMFQRWHLDMREDTLRMPKVIVITLDYRNDKNFIFWNLNEVVDDFFKTCSSLQKIILLCHTDPNCFDKRVEVHLQSSVPMVKMEQEYR